MYPNRIARGDGSTFSREKGRRSAMPASSGFKGSCNYRSKPSHKHALCFKFLRESGGGPLPLGGAGRSSWCSLHNTHIHNNADCRAQQQQRGNGSGHNRDNNSGNGNRRHHGDGSNTGRQNGSHSQRHVFAYSHCPCPGCSGYFPVYSGCCSACSSYLLHCLLRFLPRLLLRRTSSSHLHRALAFRSSQAPLLRAH